jgi:hypothetical protein
MRFLLRLTFWLGVVLLLLPSSGSQPVSQVQISASEAISAAKATVGDMRQFCDRQPDACVVGSQAAQLIGDRARAGARQLYEFLNERLARPEPERDEVITATANAPGGKAVPLPPPRSSESTLAASDLVPPWRGPPAHKPAHGGP